MATYTRREVTTRRIEWAVPALPPYGASWAEVKKAFDAAEAELGWEPFDDEIVVLPGDDEVIISITKSVEKT